MGSRGLSANWRDGTIHSRTYHGVGTHYRPPDAHQAQEVYAIPSSRTIYPTYWIGTLRANRRATMCKLTSKERCPVGISSCLACCMRS